MDEDENEYTFEFEQPSEEDPDKLIIKDDIPPKKPLLNLSQDYSYIQHKKPMTAINRHFKINRSRIHNKSMSISKDEKDQQILPKIDKQEDQSQSRKNITIMEQNQLQTIDQTENTTSKSRLIDELNKLKRRYPLIYLTKLIEIREQKNKCLKESIPIKGYIVKQNEILKNQINNIYSAQNIRELENHSRELKKRIQLLKHDYEEQKIYNHRQQLSTSHIEKRHRLKKSQSEQVLKKVYEMKKEETQLKSQVRQNNIDRDLMNKQCKGLEKQTSSLLFQIKNRENQDRSLSELKSSSTQLTALESQQKVTKDIYQQQYDDIEQRNILMQKQIQLLQYKIKSSSRDEEIRDDIIRNLKLIINTQKRMNKAYEIN